MNRTLSPVLLSVLLLYALAPPLRAQQAREHHPWGGHPVGSWKRVRVQKMTYDKQGLAGTSIEESTTTLIAVTDRQYTLRIETTVEVAGSKIRMAPREVTFGYHGESADQMVVVKQLPDAELRVDGVNVDCQVTEATISGEDTRRVRKTFVDKRDHSVVRLETVLMRPSDDSVLYQTTAHMVCMGLLHMVVKDLQSAAIVQTNHQRPELVSETWELQCPEVPGGVVEQWSKTAASGSGQLRQRSHLELLDYEIKPEADGSAGEDSSPTDDVADDKPADDKPADDKPGDRRPSGGGFKSDRRSG